MAGEVANIAEVANRVSEDIFHWFKWEKIKIMDENFKCHKADKHKKKSKKTATKSHTHPVDVVFKYFDPYLNKHILLNTDLKSYSKNSITSDKVITALDSLGKTIDCAKSSNEWINKYILDDASYEIRGLLFIYNHDEEYDKDFLNHINSKNSDKISIEEDQILHFIEPERIRYLTSVIADMNKLQATKELPTDNYSFFYPDLFLHKSHGDPDTYPATIEMLCSPYMILRHNEFKAHNEKTGELDRICPEGGYVIYYNKDGSSEHEFTYLLDSLSRYQILSSKSTIKIRVSHQKPSNEIMSNFHKAKNSYARLWNYDNYKMKDLERIEFNIITKVVPNYMPGVLAWRY